MKIVIRHFDPNSDSSFIYSSSYKQVKYAHFHPQADDDDFFSQFQEYIRNLLAHAKIFVACPYDDQNTVLGYSIINKNTLEFVYVKELFRKQSIATLLTQNKGITDINPNNLTIVAKAILEDHPKLFKPQEETLKKEESNEILKSTPPTVN